MNKAECRAFLAEVKPFIKISYFADLLNINRSQVSRFMKSNLFDYELSEDLANELVNLIIETLAECV